MLLHEKDGVVAKNTAVAPAGGCVTPSFIMVAIENARASDVRRDEFMASKYLNPIPITMEMICPAVVNSPFREQQVESKSKMKKSFRKRTDNIFWLTCWSCCQSILKSHESPKWRQCHLKILAETFVEIG